MVCLVFFFKQKTAYEMRISDWSSDVCSSDLNRLLGMTETAIRDVAAILARLADGDVSGRIEAAYEGLFGSLRDDTNALAEQLDRIAARLSEASGRVQEASGEISSGSLDLSQRTESQAARSDEQTSELQSLMRISYAVSC